MTHSLYKLLGSVTLVSVLVICLILGLSSLVQWVLRARSKQNLAAAQPPKEDAEWTELNMRREMYEGRINNIDEPRMCMKRGIPCTCWSFCGGESDLSIKQEVSANAESPTVKQPESGHASMPVIHPKSSDDCPFT